MQISENTYTKAYQTSLSILYSLYLIPECSDRTSRSSRARLTTSCSLRSYMNAGQLCKDERRESMFTNICFRTREVKVSLSYLLVNALVNNYSILRLYRYVAEHKPRDPTGLCPGQQLRANQGLNVHKERATCKFASTVPKPTQNQDGRNGSFEYQKRG